MSAATNATAERIEIRPCAGFVELNACVELQRRTWGLSDEDVIPRRAFVVAQSIGGQVLGAFRKEPASEMVGFAMALPGIRDGQPYLHSHMLAVDSQFRNAGIGRQLKLAQRADALKRCIHLMEWTFDPLEIKNSFFNIARLGAICRRYGTDVYGVSSARLQGGRPTDRLYAEWWMDSERVKAAVEAKSSGLAANAGVNIEERICLPADVTEWKESAAAADQALVLQRDNRKCFIAAFSRGLAVTGFSLDTSGNGTFELSRWKPPAHPNAASKGNERPQ